MMRYSGLYLVEQQPRWVTTNGSHRALEALTNEETMIHEYQLLDHGSPELLDHYKAAASAFQTARKLI